VVRRCAALLDGAAEDTELVVLLGGAPARRLVASGVAEDQRYWLKVWAARGLLWAGVGETSDGAPGALGRALRDDSWRVREMAAKVVARHVVEDLLDDVIELESDPVERVRVQASRAVRRIIGGQLEPTASSGWRGPCGG
jgi:hypothetical protein